MKRKKSLAWALYRKCNVYKEWSVDSIYPFEDKKRARYIMEQNNKQWWAKNINLKQKIKKVRITIEEIK